MASNAYTVTLVSTYQNLPPLQNPLPSVEIFDYQYTVPEYDSAKTSYEVLSNFATGYVDTPKIARLSPGVNLPLTNILLGITAIANSFTYDLSSDTLMVMGSGVEGASALPMAHQLHPNTTRVRQNNFKTLITDTSLGITVSSGNRNTVTITNFLNHPNFPAETKLASELIFSAFRMVGEHVFAPLATGLGGIIPVIIRFQVLHTKNQMPVSFSLTGNTSGFEVNQAGKLRPTGDPSGDQNQRLDFDTIPVHKITVQRFLGDTVDDTFYIKVNVTDVAGQ